MAKRKAKPKGRKPPPKCKAILICDQVILDAVTKKTSLIGIFDKFVTGSFPGASCQCMAYVQLVDGIGKYSLTIEIHDLRDNVVLARMPPLEIDFPERVNKAILIFAVPLFPLPHAGNYDFVIFADGQEIDRQKFEAELRQAPQQGEQHDGDAPGE